MVEDRLLQLQEEADRQRKKAILDYYITSIAQLSPTPLN